MATSVRLLRRYVWLVETIRRAKRIKLEEINQKWLLNTSLRNEDENEIPERTFHRHRDAIADIFGIEILCDRSAGNVYYVANEEELIKPSFTAALFNGLSIDNQLISNREVSKRILFEETPGGAEYLPLIIEALSKNLIIKMDYRSFNNPQQKQYKIEPYALKQSDKRWYLISHIPDFETLTVFALDRIEDMSLTDVPFVYDANWNIDDYFNEVIGVNLEDEYECEDIKIRVYGHQRNYIESLPLHRSQKLIKREKEYSDYSFKLRAEYEFQHEILKMGFNAEVLSPQWLRNEIRWRAQEILNLYKENPV